VSPERALMQGARGLPIPRSLVRSQHGPSGKPCGIRACNPLPRALFPENAGEDTQRFREVKRARDTLAHGVLRDEAELPVGRAADGRTSPIFGRIGAQTGFSPYVVVMRCRLPGTRAPGDPRPWPWSPSFPLP